MDLLGYYNELWARLPKDIPANLEFAGLVASNEKYNVNYFFGEFSEPILKWLAINLYPHKQVEIITPFILSEYFLFVANPDEKGKCNWKPLTEYKGKNGAKLETWLKLITKNEFVRKRKKQIEQQKSEFELLEFVDYETLLSRGESIPDLSDEELIHRHRLQRAWDSLSEKDKDVLHILLINKLYWADAFEELKVYIKPKDGKDAMEMWSDKKKQDALASLKGRAIKHLIAKFNKEKTVNNG